jgi:hypothetical protein
MRGGNANKLTLKDFLFHKSLKCAKRDFADLDQRKSDSALIGGEIKVSGIAGDLTLRGLEALSMGKRRFS